MIHGFKKLLSLDPESPEIKTLFQKAKESSRQRFGNTIQMYAPLYLSNECIDRCTYCGFSQENRIPRYTLSLEEIVKEASFLKNQGIAHLLLVSGEHTRIVSEEYLKNAIRTLRPSFSALSIEVAPMKEESYRHFIEAGLDGVILYQETYQKDSYEKHHLSGPKKSWKRRIQAPEEALKAGIHRLGMGILLGLSPWQDDAVALLEHLNTLRKKYWKTEFTISLPRLQPCASNFRIPHPVSDADFRKLVAALRVTLPEVGILLSTREKADFRNELVELGISEMSAGSKTEPGGYTQPNRGLRQFDISDERSIADVGQMLKKKGLIPVFKDWENMLTRESL